MSSCARVIVAFLRVSLAAWALFATSLIVSLALSRPAGSSERIGAAEIVTNRVTGELGAARRVLGPTDNVHLNEMIRTEAASATQIRFRDNSDLRLGPSAQIRLDAFVFSGRPGAAMQMTRGALRFISGNGPSGSYQIRTPVATIGLRGTGVGVVLRGGRAYVTLLSGAARVCSTSGRCSDLTNPCDYVVADGRTAEPQRPLAPGVPTFSAVCTGPACGEVVCAADASPSGRNRPVRPGGFKGQGLPGGYDPAGTGAGKAEGNSGGNTGGGGRGKY